MIQISLDNGKYTLNLPTEIGETMTCDRYEEKNWRVLTGDNLVMALGQKIIELQTEKLVHRKVELSSAYGKLGIFSEQYKPQQERIAQVTDKTRLTEKRKHAVTSMLELCRFIRNTSKNVIAFTIFSIAHVDNCYLIEYQLVVEND